MFDINLYTQTCPDLVPFPFPLLLGAPIATIVPSSEILTLVPLSLVEFSPLMSPPSWSQPTGPKLFAVVLLALYLNTRTFPASVPFELLFLGEPIATIEPSLERLTLVPL